MLPLFLPPPTYFPEDLKVRVTTDVLVKVVPVVFLHFRVAELCHGWYESLLLARPQLVDIAIWVHVVRNPGEEAPIRLGLFKSIHKHRHGL